MMCLAMPMLLVDVRDNNATGLAELDGVSHEVDLSLLELPHLGDYVIVHAGFAIEKLDTAEADARIDLFQSMAEQRGKEA